MNANKTQKKNREIENSERNKYYLYFANYKKKRSFLSLVVNKLAKSKNVPFGFSFRSKIKHNPILSKQIFDK
jgi:hypothetical protein